MNRTARSLLVTVAVVAAQFAVGAPPAWADVATKPARTWGTNGRVNAVLPIGDRIFVGGTFTSVIDTSGRSYPARNLAVFSATTGAADLAFGVVTNNSVFALATDGASTLYLGGTFGTVTNGGTASRSGLAAVDITTGAVSSWAPSVSGGQVDALAYSAGTGSIYAGGNFASVVGAGGTFSPNGFIAKIAAVTGAVDTGFSTAPSGRVRSLNVAADGSGRLFLGGDFLSVSGASRSKSLAAVGLATGAVSAGFVPEATNQTKLAPVFDITSDLNRVYVAAGGSGGACTALAVATGDLVWTAHSNGNMQSVRLIGPTLYCGGHYGGTGSFLGANRQKLAAVVAATGALLPFNPKVNTPLGVWSLGTQLGDPNLYIGGDFTKVTRVAQPHFAMFLDTTLQGPPQAPGGLVAQPADGSVRLSWSVPSSDGGQTIKSYLVYRGTSPGGENMANPLARLRSSTSVTYTDSAVTNGTTYYYVVVAQNSLGRSDPSNEASARPGASVSLTPPSAPLSLVATNPPGTIELDWNPPADNGGAPVQSYNLYRGLWPGGQGATPYATGVTGTAFSDQFGLVAGTTYYYTVTAFNAAGEGPPAGEVSAILQPGKPGPPVLSGSAVTGGVRLSWTAPPDGGSPILKYVLLRDSVRLDGSIPGSQTTYDVPTTGPTDVHVYQVKAVNAVGGGQLSNKVTI